MGTRWDDYRLFWKEFRGTFESTGAVLPSGPALCRALAKHVSVNGRPRRLLEVGPGTGVVTERIVKQMGPDDRLDIVELNDRFVERLKKRLEGESRFAEVRDRVQLHHMPMQEFATDEPFDAIVSGLPLNNFPVALVRDLLTHFQRLAADDATISFFEYVAVRKMKSLFSRQAERQRLMGIERAVGEACGRLRFDRQCIVANVPPAWVHHLRMSSQEV